MNEEAGFIAALLAEPADRTVLLVYADWLDERDDPRGQYLRALTAKRRNQRRLAQLRRTLDPGWACLVTTRFALGCQVRITSGSFAHCEGALLRMCLSETGEIIATVLIAFWGRPLDVEIECSEIERVVQPTGT